MFKRFTNRQLTLFLLATLAVYGLSWALGSRPARTFEKSLATVDTAQVSRLRIEGPGGSVQLQRSGGKWQVELPGGASARTALGKVDRALGQVANLEATRLVSRSEADWGEYGVSDSATRVEVATEAGTVLEAYLGRSEYQPGGMATYLRLAEDETTYLVPGYLNSTFAAQVADWRDKTLLQENSVGWQRLRFAYPGDSAFALLKDSTGNWMLAEDPESPLAQAAVSAYLSRLSNLKGSTFAEQDPSGDPAQQIVIEGGQVTLTLSAHPAPAGGYLVGSSQQPGTFFAGEGGGLYEQVFVGKAEFLPEETEE